MEHIEIQILEKLQLSSPQLCESPQPRHQGWGQVSFQKRILAPTLKLPHRLKKKMEKWTHIFPAESCPICRFVSKINVIIV